MRYVLVAESAAVTLAPTSTTAPSGLADLLPTFPKDANGNITGCDDAGVTLDFAAYDPAQTVAPVEVRAYWTPVGSPIQDAAAIMAGGYASAVAAVSVPPEGLPGLVLPTPDAARPAPGATEGGCLVRVIVGFAS